MNDFALVTDSSCSLPLELVKTHGITVVPIYMEWKGRFVRDGLDMTAVEVYDFLREHPGVSIRSSTPPPAEFLSVYDALLQEHQQVLSIHVAGTLTSIVEIAGQAARARRPGDVQVVDSRTASMGLGFAVLAAARAREAGADRETAARKAGGVGAACRLFGLVETLSYVKSSGRLMGAGVKAGSSLRLRPLIVVADGQVRLQGVVRTRRRGIEKVVEAVKAASGGEPAHLAVVHADVPDEAEALAERLRAELDCAELIVSEFTPVLGGHTGPGFIGVVVYRGA